MSLIIFFLNHLRTNVERLLAWERSTYETVEACCSEDQTGSSRHDLDQPAKTIQEPLPPGFTQLFHEKLPRELRDLVYAHVLGFERATWTIQRDGFYFRYDRRTADIPVRIIPESLELSPYPISRTLRREVAAYFFSTNLILLRYRYDSTTLEILTGLCRHTGCRPNQYIKRLKIFICPPESPEDDMFCDEEAEFEWHHMFPQPKNARSLAQRRQLEADLHEISLHISEDCDTEFTFMISEQEWQASLGPNGMDEWLCSIKGSSRIRLFCNDWEKIII